MALDVLASNFGLLVTIAGLAFLTNSFTHFLAPAFANALSNYMLALDGIGEISLTLWLLVMGVNVAKWNERAYPTSAS